MTGVVRVIDAHPAGTYSITVRAFNSNGLTATRTFTLTITTPVTCTPVSFAAPLHFDAGFNCFLVAIGDFNRDGKQDLVVANNNPDIGDVSILLGDGTGHFIGPTNFHSGGSSPNALAVGDFNGDGKQDLAVALSSTVTILLGDGMGNFGAPTSFGAGNSPYSVATGDFNRDGKQDLVVTNAFANTVSILLGDGAGHFNAPMSLVVATRPQSVVVGEFNGDDKQDLAVANLMSNNVSILIGDGAGSFSSPTNFDAGTGPDAVALGDFNHDNKQDLAVANNNSGNVSILLGDGTGHFSEPTNLSAGAYPRSVALGDFNGDGEQDLAVANLGSDTVSILVGDGSGNFSNPIGVAPVAEAPASVAVGDFNGDGKQDLVTANTYSDNVSILLRNCGPTPTPTATGSPPPMPTLGNYSDTSILLSTETTVAPDAPPSNTTSINVSTSTNFKGTLEAEPATGIVRVTNPHPAGTYTVTVLGLNGTAPTATKTFTLTVTTPVACPPVTFAAPAHVAVGSPTSVAVGDFNRDGRQDLAVLNTSDDKVVSLFGDGTGHFVAGTAFPTGGEFPVSVAVGDFNGDGKQDLAMANSSLEDDSNVSVLLGDGTGLYYAIITFGSGISARRLAVSDFNGDGKQDLVVSNFDSSASVSIFLGDGTGHFSGPTDFDTDLIPTSIVIGDFNGDGKRDIATANSSSNNVSILLGDGEGRFAAPTNFAVGSVPSSLAMGDFNGDNKQDLVVVNSNENFGNDGDLSLLLGDGMGGFNPATNFGAGTRPRSVATGDFDSDGQLDLAVIYSNLVSILLGDGAGNFSAPTNFTANFGPFSITVGDFNGNGRQDLVTTDTGQNVSIFLRPCGSDPTPTATATSTPTATATPTSTVAPSPTPTPSPAQSLNLSTRMLVRTGDQVGIGGFIITGSTPKQVLIRAIGPSLTKFGVPNALADPIVELNGPPGFPTTINDNWMDGSGGPPIFATGLAPTNDLEAAILVTLDPGAFTTIVKGKDNGTGVGLIEVFDLDPANSVLGNISTRAFVGSNTDVTIGGFILGNGTQTQVIVRGVGPSLASAGVPNPLADPTLALYNNNGVLLAANDNWQDDPASAGQLTTHGLALANSLESGIFASLQPGLYTAILAGTNGGTGVGLVEVYNLQ